MPSKSDDREEREKKKTAAMVDRLLKQLPGLNEPEPPPPAPVTPSGSRPAIRRVTGQQPKVMVGAAKPMPSGLAVWGRTLLVLLLAVGVSQWPYANECGFPLYGYMAVLGALIAGGVWAALSCWRARLGVAHCVALSVILFGGALLVELILSRTGYAVFQATWTC